MEPGTHSRRCETTSQNGVASLTRRLLPVSSSSSSPPQPPPRSDGVSRAPKHRLFPPHTPPPPLRLTPAETRQSPARKALDGEGVKSGTPHKDPPIGSTLNPVVVGVWDPPPPPQTRGGSRSQPLLPLSRRWQLSAPPVSCSSGGGGAAGRALVDGGESSQAHRPSLRQSKRPARRHHVRLPPSEPQICVSLTQTRPSRTRTRLPDMTLKHRVSGATRHSLMQAGAVH